MTDDQLISEFKERLADSERANAVVVNEIARLRALGLHDAADEAEARRAASYARVQHARKLLGL